MIGLIVYGTFVGLLVLGAARAGESVARTAGRPLRWIWFTAMLATLGFSFAGVNRATRASGQLPRDLVVNVDTGAAQTGIAHTSLLNRAIELSQEAQRPLNGALARV